MIDNGCVVETCDVVFDEVNGYHGEQVDLSDVGEEDSSQDILSMGVGTRNAFRFYAIWVPKTLVTNLRGPIAKWVPLTK